MLETPERGLHVEYQYLVTLQKTDGGYIIAAIQKVAGPIDFALLDSID